MKRTHALGLVLVLAVCAGRVGAQEVAAPEAPRTVPRLCAGRASELPGRDPGRPFASGPEQTWVSRFAHDGASEVVSLRADGTGLEVIARLPTHPTASALLGAGAVLALGGPRPSIAAWDGRGVLGPGVALPDSASAVAAGTSVWIVVTESAGGASSAHAVVDGRIVATTPLAQSVAVLGGECTQDRCSMYYQTSTGAEVIRLSFQRGATAFERMNLLTASPQALVALPEGPVLGVLRRSDDSRVIAFAVQPGFDAHVVVLGRGDARPVLVRHGDAVDALWTADGSVQARPLWPRVGAPTHSAPMPSASITVLPIAEGLLVTGIDGERAAATVLTPDGRWSDPVSLAPAAGHEWLRAVPMRRGGHAAVMLTTSLSDGQHWLVPVRACP